MVNYISAIEEDLRKIYERASKLKIALEILHEYKGEVSQPERAHRAQVEGADHTQIEHKKREPKKKITRRNFGKNMYMRTTDQVLTVLDAQTEPIRKKQIDMAVRQHMQVSDNLLWKVMRDLRDKGIVTWNEETRLYSLNRTQPQVRNA
jgi:hypothetical protein